MSGIIVQRTVFLGDTPLQYTLERKNVKNLNLHVRKDGSVYVSANAGVQVEKIEEFMWRLKNDKPPEMMDIAPKLALQSLAQIFAKGNAELPLVEVPMEFEKELRELAGLQSEIAMHSSKMKGLEKDVETRVVRIAEFMKEHEHGELKTASGRLRSFTVKERR